MLYALLYRSVATHPVGELSLRALTVRAAQRNKELGVTGVLLHGVHEHLPEIPGAFLQWIEGPEEAVRKLFESISDDPRHQNVETIAEGPLAKLAGTNQRLFPDWDMEAGTIGELPATLAGFLTYVRRQKRGGGWALAA
ncbi:BLUF domain-containing protein [Rubricoccus marinus]|uniref:BLUF domain-containing protein n=1 Tax=Rubricoccus marinus TaxID=716817 RepID=A0A259TVD2_9BACT|nr:BLUF domain-containing protein [Rubricoccus marinus]OZC01725.1 hypothetical protein BSZ36_01230 [Rubricoccus marinus]